MTKSYAQLQKQIQTLQKQADEARKLEIQGVIGRIREAIDAYGLTLTDLGFRTSAKAKTAKPAKPARRTTARKGKVTAVVKYRDEAGNSWVGRGPHPHWLRDALKAGKSLKDFAV